MENTGYRINEDGIIECIGNADLQNNEISALNEEILDIIKINSYSKELLAAYKARKIANRISREKYGKPNYKEYVEMLMVKHFPRELEKARLGAKYAIMLCLLPLLVFVLVLLWIFIIWNIYGYYKVIIVSIIAAIICMALLGLFVWKLFIPTYHTIKEMQNGDAALKRKREELIKKLLENKIIIPEGRFHPS
jgi:uncharacterized membrane protein YqjE